MRLIKCYIENFGMLSHYSCEFSDGLNCIFSNNSTGKTTLSVFIKAMLYGLSDTRKSDLDENDRKKYYPWQGGAFGGSLSLEVGGKRYTIERSFGDKPSQDRFCLRNFDTGAVCYDYTESFGEQTLGIDRDGFSRTVFLSEADTEDRKGYTTVASRLGNLGTDSSALNEYARAEKILEQRRKFYHKRGGGGEISQLRARLDALERELDRLTVIRDSLPERAGELARMRTEAAELEDERSRLTLELSRAGKASARDMEWSRLDGLKSAEARERALLRETEEFFGGNIPTADEIDRARDDYNEAKRLLRESADEVSPEERDRLAAAYRGKTSREEIYGIETRLERLETVRSRIDGIKRGTDVHSQRMAEMLSLGADITGDNSKEKRGSPIKTFICAVYIVLGLLLGVAGIYLGAISNTLWYIVSVIGAISVLYGGIRLALLRGAKRSANRTERKNNEGLGLYNSERELRDRELAELSAERSALEERIDAFLARFDTPGVFGRSERLRRISDEYRRYYSAIQGDGCEADIKKHRADELNKRAGEFVSRFAITGADPFAEIRARLAEYEYRRAILDKTEQERRALEARLGSVPYKQSAPNEREILNKITEAEARLGRVRRVLTLKEQEYRAAERECDSYDEVLAESTAHREALEEYTRNLSVIQKTAELLREASENMTGRYLDRTKERLSYYRELMGAPPAELNLDSVFTVTKNERGGARARESYSRGTKELESLALQLALCDSLYAGGDMPPLILDDPFIALDDEKCKKGKAMLLQMARERQILYFTCSESRTF